MVGNRGYGIMTMGKYFDRGVMALDPH